MHGPICRARAGQHRCRMRHAPNKSTRTAGPVVGAASPCARRTKENRLGDKGRPGLQRSASNHAGRAGTRRESGHAKEGGGWRIGSMRCARQTSSSEGSDVRASGSGHGVSCPRAHRSAATREGRGRGRRQSSREQGRGRVGRGGTAHTRPRPGGRGSRCRPPDGPRGR